MGAESSRPPVIFGSTSVEITRRAARLPTQRMPSSSHGSTGTRRTANQTVIRSLPNSPAVKRKKPSRRKSNHEPDPSSNTNADPDDIRDIEYHFVRRLTRFVRLAGIGQYISEQTGIPRSEVFLPYASEFQDRSSSQAGIHAGHIVRVGLNGSLERNFPEMFVPLRNFVGHTHFIPQYANVWHGIGGAIDRIQARFLGEISIINFRGYLDSHGQDILRRLRQAFIDAFNDAINYGSYSAQQVWAMQGVVAAIEQFTLLDLFEKGQLGLDFLTQGGEEDDWHDL